MYVIIGNFLCLMKNNRIFDNALLARYAPSFKIFHSRHICDCSYITNIFNNFYMFLMYHSFYTIYCSYCRQN